MFVLLFALCSFAAARDQVVWEAGFEARPVPLFLNSSHTTFELQQEGVRFLERLGDTKISLVSVGGQARAGKSFLLNNLVRAEHCTHPPCTQPGAGFGVGSSFDACTRGVWLWGKPVFKTAADGSRFAVVYMDTEGLGAIGNVRDNQDPKLALFASLFSSSFYYVVHRVISQEAVDFLHSVAVFSHKVHRDMGNDAAGNTGMGAMTSKRAGSGSAFPFASLFWIVQNAELCDGDADTSAGGDTAAIVHAAVANADTVDGANDEVRARVSQRAACAEAMRAKALTKKQPGSAPPEVVARYNDVVDLVTSRFAPIEAPPRAMALAHPKAFVCADEADTLAQHASSGTGAANAPSAAAAAAAARALLVKGLREQKRCRKLRSPELPLLPLPMLEPEYRLQIDSLRRAMEDRARPKPLGAGGALTGKAFASLSARVLSYFNTFNGAVDRGILQEFADAAADEAASLFVRQLLRGLAPRSDASTNTNTSVDAGSGADTARCGLPAGACAALSALSERTERSGHSQQDAPVQGDSSAGDRDRDNSLAVDVENFARASAAARERAFGHFDSNVFFSAGAGVDAGAGAGNAGNLSAAAPRDRFTALARRRLGADIEQAVARAALANRAAAEQHCDRTLSDGFVSRVVNAAPNAGANHQKPTASDDHDDSGGAARDAVAGYKQAKRAFSVWWAGRCMLPRAEAQARWHRFEATHMALHESWVQREAGRAALRDLRRVVLRAAFAAVVAGAVVPWVPGVPRTLVVAVAVARNLCCLGALAVAASDLQLAPGLIEERTLEAALVAAAPAVEAMLRAAGAAAPALSSILAFERQVRLEIINNAFGARGGSGEPAGGGSSA
eukprot:g2578.t1